MNKKTCMYCGGFNGENYCYRRQEERRPDHPACNKFTELPEYLLVDRLEGRI